MNNPKLPPLKVKNVKNRIVFLSMMRYKEVPVYIRLIGTDLFMFDLVFKNEIYSGNLIFAPRQGKVRLNKQEIQYGRDAIWSAAVATVEHLLGNTLDEQKAQIARQFIKMGRKHMTH